MGGTAEIISSLQYLQGFFYTLIKSRKEDKYERTAY